ncbi:hypothetical protein B0H14DRAFT_2564008 [Mycena olivaceomarginata]|nr:hypothetical protein B0H14DRAFT_2564008 [Mycena olivaceomarginata]
MVICMLLEAVWTGEYRFKKLGQTEAAERRQWWDDDVAAGQVIAKHRAPRCDASQPYDTDEDKENEPPCPNNADNNTGATVSGPLPKKRACTKQTSSPGTAKPCTKMAAPRKKAAPAVKKAVAAKHASASAQDNDMTRGAVDRLKAQARVCKVTSRLIITSDDECDDNPSAENNDPNAPITSSSSLVMPVPPPSA